MKGYLMNNIVKAVVCLFFILGLGVEASPATKQGVHFEDEIAIAGNYLNLHGIGTLTWGLLVKVYMVALYKPDTVRIEQLLEDVPKRLEFYFLVDTKASDFQNSGFDLMVQNVGEKKAESLDKELKAFNSFYRDVKAGQRYMFTYIPGRGLEMALDGEVLGQVKGEEFAAAYLSIWLGPKPVSANLQKGLFHKEMKIE
jgi:hypothetical protein